MRTRQFDNVLRVSGRAVVAQAITGQPRSYIIAPSRLTAGMVVAHCCGQWGNLPFPSVEAAEEHCRDDAKGRGMTIRREGGL